MGTEATLNALWHRQLAPTSSAATVVVDGDALRHDALENALKAVSEGSERGAVRLDARLLRPAELVALEDGSHVSEIALVVRTRHEADEMRSVISLALLHLVGVVLLRALRLERDGGLSGEKKLDGVVGSLNKHSLSFGGLVSLHLPFNHPTLSVKCILDFLELYPIP